MKTWKLGKLGWIWIVIGILGWGCDDPGDSESADEDIGGETDDGQDVVVGGETDPLPEADEGVWTWVPVGGARCRDGSQAGLSVRYGASREKLLIFTQGGGACFNYTTCLANPENIATEARFPEEAGLFDPGNDDNPVADYSAVFIPFCTGDVHTGAKPDGQIDNIDGPQQFVGGDNYERFLARIVPTFPDATKVLVAGVSAGGFGALFNYWKVLDAFGDGVSVVAIDDAGPAMRDPWFSACLQNLVRTSWGLDEHLPADCDACFAEDGSGLHALAGYIAENYPNASMGLISSMEDATIRSFWGYGLDDCNVLLPLYSGELYTEGLEDLRAYYEEISFMGTFYFPGSDHTTLLTSNLYSRAVGDATLLDWIEDIIAGTMPHVGPDDAGASP